MARMSIDDMFLRDPRVKLLATSLGWSKYEARGRLLDVFAVVYDRVDAGEDDVLTAVAIDTAAEWDGLAARMLEVGLVEQVAHGLRIKGAHERTKYLATRESSGRKGGVKSGETRRKKAAERAKVTFAKPEGPSNPIPTAPDPVPDSASPDLHTHARAGGHPQRGALARKILTYCSQKQSEIKQAGIDPTAPQIAIMPNAEDFGWKALLARVDEQLAADPDQAEAVLRRRVDVAAAEARRDGSLRWFVPARMFDPRSFAIGVGMSPEQAAKPRAPGFKRPDEPKSLRIRRDDDDPPPLPRES